MENTLFTGKTLDLSEEKNDKTPAYLYEFVEHGVQFKVEWENQ